MNYSLQTKMKCLLLRMFFLIAVTAACLPNKPALAASPAFRVSLAVSEEITDNVFETANNKRTEYITRIQPGFTSRYEAPFWKWDLGYNLDYRNYARSSREDEYTHNGVLKGNLTLLDNFLFLDLNDTYQRVTLDVARNAATESSLFLNQTDQNIATISPYLLWRLGSKGSLRTGYRYIDVRYWGDGIERREHVGFASLNHEVSSKFSLSVGYNFTHLESQPTQYNKHDLFGGCRYEFADKSFLFGQVGHSWQQFQNGRNASYIFWNAGVTHDMGFVLATLETRVQTAEDPLAVSTKETIYSAKLEKILERGMIGISSFYSEYVNTQTDRTDQRKLALNGMGRYEVFQNIYISLYATAERYYVTTGTDLPYHLNTTGGLSYSFNHDLSLSLNYMYDTKRNDLGDAAGAIDINKMFIEVKMLY